MIYNHSGGWSLGRWYYMYGYFGNFHQEVGTDPPPPILVPGTNCQYKGILYTPPPFLSKK